MFCDLYMRRNNLEVLFLNFCKWINNLILTLLVHWSVWKYSDLIIFRCFVQWHTALWWLVCLHISGLSPNSPTTEDILLPVLLSSLETGEWRPASQVRATVRWEPGQADKQTELLPALCGPDLLEASIGRRAAILCCHRAQLSVNSMNTMHS